MNTAQRTWESSLTFIIPQSWGTSKLGATIRILGVAPKVDEKDVALKVGKKAASHLNPLHAAPGSDMSMQV